MRLIHALASPPMALLAGAAQALSMADPWTGQAHWWLQLLSLSWLVWQLAHRAERQMSWSASTWASPETGTAWRRALWLGWLFGLGWLALLITVHRVVLGVQRRRPGRDVLPHVKMSAGDWRVPHLKCPDG